MNYELLRSRPGAIYTFHGGLMVGGGLLFGFSSIKAGILWRNGLILFVLGLLLNLIIAFLPLPDIVQIAGSVLRNLGLIGIGFGLLKMLKNNSDKIAH